MTDAALRTVEEIDRASGGYAVETADGEIYIPVVMMNPPGKGRGGQFLDALPRDRTVKFPCVMSPILEGMLERRGFRQIMEWSVDMEEWVPVHVRKAEVPS